MSRRGWTSYNPMKAVVFEPIADAMLLEHTMRVAVSSMMLRALTEHDPERWGTITLGIQDSILRAYDSCSVKLLADTLAAVERIYENIARDHGMDPQTGHRLQA